MYWFVLLPLLSLLLGCASVPPGDDLISPIDQRYVEELMAEPVTFKISRQEGADVWGRAQAFIGRYADMKLQINTDYILQTYNPSPYRFGYYITKAPVGDSLEINIQCVAEKEPTQSRCNACICARYIRTGEIKPAFMTWFIRHPIKAP